jgi:hypothetical protein
LSRVIWPSAWPLLQGVVSAAWIAAPSCSSPAAKVSRARTPDVRAPPVAAVNGPAGMSAIRAAAAGSRALGGDGQKTRVLARDLFDAAARHRTELVHAPFYGVRCITLQTSAPTSAIHANCGRATPRGEAHCTPATATLKPFAFHALTIIPSSLAPPQWKSPQSGAVRAGCTRAYAWTGLSGRDPGAACRRASAEFRGRV